MRPCYWILVTTHLLAVGIAFADQPTSTTDRSPGGRVETTAELEAFQPFEEIERLGIFIDEPVEVVLPNLRKAKVLSIDSDEVVSVSLPGLESVSYLIVRGEDLEKLDLPNLRTIGELRVQGTKIGELDLQSLRRAGKLVVTSNPALATIKTPVIYELDHLTITNNVGLDEADQQRLASIREATHVEPLASYSAAAVTLRRPSIPPTGTKNVKFDSMGLTRRHPSHRNVYPRYAPFYPIFRPFLGGYWSFGPAPF